jgi:hypothetical protein
MAQPSFSNDPQPPSGADTLNAVEDGLKEAGLQADTFARSAANTLTFGLADNGEAALDATFGQGGPGDWGQRYQNELNQQKARDVYDSINRGFADRLGQITGVGLGLVGGAEGGVAWSEGLPSMAKGKLGEGLSEAKSFLDANPALSSQVVKKLSRGYTRADHLTADGTYVEAKFGPNASLSPAQTRAQTELGPQYRVDWWLPKHVGYLGGGLAGVLSAFSAAGNQQPHQVQPPVSGVQP